MLPEKTFQNQVVLITGGSAGLRLIMTDTFLSLSARGAICERDEGKLQKALKHFGEKDRAFPYPWDVREPHRVRAMFREIRKKWGGVDHLINKAEGNFIRPSEELPEKAFGIVVDIVLKGTFHCSRAFARQCIARKRGGTIVNILGTYACHEGPGTVHSASVKSGVLAMTRILAVEWSPYGIWVNAVAPCPLETRGAEDRLWPTEELKKKVPESTLQKRFIPLREVAHAVCYLASPYAENINGVYLTLDGGDWLGWGALKATGGEIPIVRRKR